MQSEADSRVKRCAVGSARASRLRLELEAARVRVRTEVQTAADAYEKRAEAVRILETEALPGLDENDRLITRSFEVGQLGLPDLLLIRRETLETRMQYLDTLLEAALAQIELRRAPRCCDEVICMCGEC